MTDSYDISRRKVLTGIGTIGVSGAAAGLGTNAYLNDTESFEDNGITAGELDLIVDWEYEYDQGSAGSASASGRINGTESEYALEVSDLKPGDSGTFQFCPKVVSNPAWLWVGSDDGVVDYENGLSEPEAVVDDTGGDPGEGAGELSENVQVTVSYCAPDGETIREMDDPEEYSLADLSADLESGFLLETAEGSGTYPASPDDETQAGPCLCIEWEVPTDVGNEIQTDSVAFSFEFYAEQERHNPTPASPYSP